MERSGHNSDECAVSPVVGVMLMLVVVIIIAAVVSAFSGGLAKTSDKAPQVSLDVKIDSVEDQVLFTHLSGETLNTRDLAIITYFTNKSSYTYKHTQTASSNVTVISTGKDERVPHLADMFTGYAHSNPETKDFGNFSLKTGDVMSTYNLRGTADILGIGWTSGSPDTYNDPGFTAGSVVNVKIQHMPSGKIIFDRDVTVS